MLTLIASSLVSKTPFSRTADATYNGRSLSHPAHFRPAPMHKHAKEIRMQQCIAVVMMMQCSKQTQLDEMGQPQNASILAAKMVDGCSIPSLRRGKHNVLLVPSALCQPQSGTHHTVPPHHGTSASCTISPLGQHVQV